MNREHPQSKIYSMIGLAGKAGRVVSGDDTVRCSIQHNKVKLLIISTDASENTMKRFRNAAAYYKVEVEEFGCKEQLGGCIGKSARSVIGITDKNFGDSIRKLIIGQQGLEKNSGGELFE